MNDKKHAPHPLPNKTTAHQNVRSVGASTGEDHNHKTREIRNVGVNVHIPKENTRARIDNLGGYHEYPDNQFRELHEEKIEKTLKLGHALKATKLKSSLPDIPTVLPASPPKEHEGLLEYNHHRNNAIFNEIRGFIPEAPIVIAPLIRATHIFFRRPRSAVPEAVTAVPGWSTREIINETEQVIFYLRQTRGTTFFAFLFLWGFFRQTFSYQVLDRNGGLALTVTGVQHLFGVRMKSKISWGPDTEKIGILYQHCCTGTYRIQDEWRKNIFTVIGPVFASYAPCVFNICDEPFEVLQHRTADDVSFIQKYWDEQSYSKNYTNFGTSFNSALSVRSKALILGTTLTIRYQYYALGGNALFLVPFYLIIIGLSVGLYYTNCFGFCP